MSTAFSLVRVSLYSSRGSISVSPVFLL